jgi:hypothetical protein
MGATPATAASTAARPSNGPLKSKTEPPRLIVNNENFVVTRISVVDDGFTTLHSLGGSVLVPMRGAVCTLFSGGRGQSLVPNAIRWSDARELIFSSTANNRCDAFLVEVKKPAHPKALYFKDHLIDPKFQSIELENDQVRVVRFRLAPQAKWNFTARRTRTLLPSVTLVTSGEKLETIRTWQPTSDQISTVTGYADNLRTRETGPSPAILSQTTANAGEGPYEVVTVELKFAESTGRGQ